MNVLYRAQHSQKYKNQLCIFHICCLGDVQGRNKLPVSKAGQCRTNPWPAVPDWPGCRLTAGKNADTGLTFSGIPAFTYSSQGLLVFIMACVFCYKNQLSYAASYWAKLQPPELPRRPVPLWTALSYWATVRCSELRCTLLSYAAPSWATLHFTEQCCVLLSLAAPFWTTLHPLNFAASINWQVTMIFIGVWITYILFSSTSPLPRH